MLNLWYKNAVIYCVDVETFMDSNRDGVGDFQGLSDRLDHIEALGANCVWLLPFFPSPNRDNGYDITDFYGVDPRLGSPGDFVSFTQAARDRGLRVIIDLVVNHTSTDHPWFQNARRDPQSPYRDWYVWSKEEPEDPHNGVVFPGVQDTIWTYDEQADAWYLHRFYDHQADLNIANPQVREEIEKIMGYWLQLGVDGFRIDAVPFLVEHVGLEDPPEQDPHRYLTEIRSFLSWRKAEAMLLAEANVTMDEVGNYFGDGDRMHIVFNFLLNQHVFLAFARGDAEPVRQVMNKSPSLPLEAQWGTFLRNHDELDLGRLSEDEREEVFKAFAPSDDMRVYGRGIRRRLAPMLEGDLGRLRMAYSLMFALPGTPVIWYGEEIGMGDDLRLDERNSVRLPMQWTDGPNAGFSDAPADRLVRPVLRDGPFGFRHINIAAQRNLAGSLMEHIAQLIRTRRSCPEIGWGDWRWVDCRSRSVLGIRCTWRGAAILTIHNFSDEPAEIAIELPDGEAELMPLLTSAKGHTLRPGEQPIAFPPYGYAWYRAHGERR